MQDLKVAIIQPNLQWEDPGANRDHLEQILDEIHEPVDLVVLPEMFPTGFTMDADPFSEEMNGPTMQWMKRHSARLDCHLTGSLIIEENGHYYNRMIWYRPDGTFEQYDKRHLFSFAGEHKIYTKGEAILEVECKGWKIRPVICYDLRFPVWCRNDTGYDLLLVISSWPARRIAHWRALLIARAIENQAFVVGGNRVGEDGNEVYHNGNSMIVSPSGKVIEEEVDSEVIIIEDLKYDAITGFRSHLTSLEDMDQFKRL